MVARRDDGPGRYDADVFHGRGVVVVPPALPGRRRWAGTGPLVGAAVGAGDAGQRAHRRSAALPDDWGVSGAETRLGLSPRAPSGRHGAGVSPGRGLLVRVGPVARREPLFSQAARAREPVGGRGPRRPRASVLLLPAWPLLGHGALECLLPRAGRLPVS